MGLIIGALFMLLGGYNPTVAYVSMIEKVIGSSYDVGELLRTIAPLILSGLAVAIAFKVGLFNIGVDGQIIMGSLGALIVGTQLSLPSIIHGIVAVLFGALLGGLWGAIAGYLKGSKGINEVITTIMLNYIALYSSHMMIRAFMPQEGTQRSELIKESASIKINFLSDMMGGARIHWGFLIVILVLVFYHYYLNKTKWGYEIRVTGLNIQATKYAGINSSKIMVRTMFISGLFGGLIGTFNVLGVFNYMAISASTSGIGFDGIAVALLGGNTAIGILLAGILFGILTYGAQGMSFGAGVPNEIGDVVISAIIFFVSAPGIIKHLLYRFRNKQKRTENTDETTKSKKGA
nr:ABC transporter permease [Oceanobacillus saliphilus]